MLCLPQALLLLQNTDLRPATMFGHRYYVKLSTVAALVACVIATPAPTITPGPVVVKRDVAENDNFIGYYSSSGASTCKMDRLRNLRPFTHAYLSQIPIPLVQALSLTLQQKTRTHTGDANRIVFGVILQLALVITRLAFSRVTRPPPTVGVMSHMTALAVGKSGSPHK
jgi:hypothetical protein